MIISLSAKQKSGSVESLPNRRVMNTMMNGLALATVLPGPLAMLALIGTQIRTAIGLARQMINPTYEEHRYEESVVVEEITSVNRKIESRIINHYKKKGLFERGKYYE